MSNMLDKFKNFQVFKKDLKEFFGDDLVNAKTEQKEVIRREDVVSAIKKYLIEEITQEVFLDWVNTVWFTELYEYAENESDSIASVMTELETLDEEGVAYSNDDFLRMIKALESNKEFVI